MSDCDMAPRDPPSPDIADSDPSSQACRVALLGLPGVGKTALTVRLLTKRFIGEYCPTLENVYRYNVKVDGETFNMEIFDTTGCQVGMSVPATYVLWGTCFIYVYSVADRTSFEELQRIKEDVDALRGHMPPYVTLLVGNQADLHHRRQVSTTEGLKLAQEWGCRHCELSACDGSRMDDIRDMFHSVYLHHKQLQSLTSYKNHLPRRLHTPFPLVRFRKAIQKVIIGTRMLRGHRNNNNNNNNKVIMDT